MVTFGTVKKTN